MQEHYSKTEMVFFSETLRVGFVHFLFRDVNHWKDAKLIAESTKKSKIGFISSYKDMV